MTKREKKHLKVYLNVQEVRHELLGDRGSSRSHAVDGQQTADGRRDATENVAGELEGLGALRDGEVTTHEV